MVAPCKSHAPLGSLCWCLDRSHRKGSEQHRGAPRARRVSQTPRRPNSSATSVENPRPSARPFPCSISPVASSAPSSDLNPSPNPDPSLTGKGRAGPRRRRRGWPRLSTPSTASTTLRRSGSNSEKNATTPQANVVLKVELAARVEMVFEAGMGGMVETAEMASLLQGAPIKETITRVGYRPLPASVRRR